MRLEFTGKTKSVLEDVDIQVLKRGQTDTVPAVLLTYMTKQPNTFLNVLDPSGCLRSFCYERGNPNRATQSTLDGVDPVSDLPFLTDNVLKMGGQFDWDYEQTGCKTVIYRGTARDASNIKLKDGTVSKVRVKCLDGGTVEVRHCFYAADLDAETIGDIAVLKKQELEIELTGPEILQQKSIEEDAGGDEQQDEPLTLEKALATALQQQHEGREVTARSPAKKVPLAKKIARHAGKQSRRGAKA